MRNMYHRLCVYGYTGKTGNNVALLITYTICLYVFTIWL